MSENLDSILGVSTPHASMSHKIALLPDEQVVTNFDNGNLILTTKRVRYDSVLLGKSNFISITLGSLASCGLVTRSFPILLLLGAIGLIGALLLRDIERFMSFAIASIMVVAYFLSRQAVLSIASNGGQAILVPTKGIKRDSIIGFIEAVENEKLK